MTPTPKLRFVNRIYVVKVPPQTEFTVSPAIFYPIEKKEVRILQQWWVRSQELEYPAVFGLTSDRELGEWRDVPIEEEQA